MAITSINPIKKPIKITREFTTAQDRMELKVYGVKCILRVCTEVESAAGAQ